MFYKGFCTGPLRSKQNNMNITRTINAAMAAVIVIAANSMLACSVADRAGWDPQWTAALFNGVALVIAGIRMATSAAFCETLLAAGFTPAASCVKAVPLMFDTVYVFNKANFTSMTASTTLGEITDFVMSGSTTGFSILVDKDSFNIAEELQEDGSWMQTVSFKLANDTSSERNFVTALKGGKLVFVARSKNDKFRVAGVNYKGNTTTPASSSIVPTGVELKTDAESYASDAFGNNITLVGEGFTEKAPYFFETSVSATVTNLESYL